MKLLPIPVMPTLTHVTIGPVLQRLRRLNQLRRARGNARVAYTLLRRLASLPLVRRCTQLCAVDLLQIPVAQMPVAARPSSLFEIRFARADELSDVAAYYADRNRIEMRAACGDRCVIAAGREALGAAAWLAIGPATNGEDWRELRCRFHVPTGVIWTYDGKGTKLGAWGTMMKQLPHLLSGQNAHTVATIIDCNNWQSLDAHRSLGYQSVGILLHVRILGCSLRGWRPAGGRWGRVPPQVHGIEIQTR